MGDADVVLKAATGAFLVQGETGHACHSSPSPGTSASAS
jgi:hypothetical protein